MSKKLCKCGKANLSPIIEESKIKTMYPNTLLYRCQNCGRIYITHGPMIIPLDKIIGFVDAYLEEKIKKPFHRERKKRELVVVFAEELKRGNKTFSQLIDLGGKKNGASYGLVRETVDLMLDCEIIREVKTAEGEKYELCPNLTTPS